MSNYSNSTFKNNNPNTSWYKAYNLIPDSSTVLDVGCSSGTFGAELISRKKCTVDGIEIDKKDFMIAKSKLRNTYNLDIERDPLDINNKYDIIYFGDVIEHLVDPSAALKKIKNLLNPKGKILFSIPNMTHIAIRLLLLKGDFEYTKTGLLDRTHLHFYGLDEVYRVFGEAGLKIDHIDFVSKIYSEETLKYWLDGVGLTANKDFYKNMKKPEASAFQFVGTAVNGKGALVKIHRNEFGPKDLSDEYHSKTIDDLNKKLKESGKEYKKLDSAYKELLGEYQELLNKWNLLKKHPIKFSVQKLKKRAKKSN